MQMRTDGFSNSMGIFFPGVNVQKDPAGKGQICLGVI